MHHIIFDEAHWTHLTYNIELSELIFKKVATEIEHILRLSKLKEYASH